MGNSEGRYAKGIGEQQDVKAAARYLADLGIAAQDAAGYSFGAWVNALALGDGKSAGRMVMISPPVAAIDFSSVSAMPGLSLVVSGSRDEYAPADQIRRLMPVWNETARFEVIDGADHFYGGHFEALEEIVFAHV